jgi:4-amino-4-deoxy-L-arabinose transferase-like glycosyltransferase
MIKLINNKFFPFWLLTITIVLVLIVSQLIQDGAFMDGMLYVSVSKNLADGIGTFWDPHFCKTYQSSFHEQPPLYFGILAVFYKLFGTSMYVERLFSLVCFLLTAFTIHKFWKKNYESNHTIKSNSWFPVFLWTVIPICFWAYTNFVEEILMSLFTLVSVYYLYVALFQEQNVHKNIAIAGVFIFLASLTKGPQGIFPIVSIGIYWLITKKLTFSKAFLYSSILVLVPVLIYGILIITNNDVVTSFEKYFQNRILNTFSHKNDTTQNRFEILIQLFWHLLPIFVISALIVLFSKKTVAQSVDKQKQKTIILWLVFIGLSGSLPLIITLEQRGFYLVTTLPFFAIAIAMWSAPKFSAIIDKIDIRSKAFKIAVVCLSLLFFSSIGYCVSKVGKAKRDANMLADVYLLGSMLPHGETISIPAPMCLDFSFKEYMIRYFYISSDDTPATHKYFIIRKDIPQSWIPEVYTKYTLDTKEFDLYILKEK